MKKRQPDLPHSFLRLRGLLIKLAILAAIISLGLLFMVRGLARSLTTSAYFQIKEIICNNENTESLSYLKGENIFTVDLKKESGYIAERYPNYRKIRLVKVLPNRIFADFLERKAVAIIKLHRNFCVDEDAVLFDASEEPTGQMLPLILGLETKIFGPKTGRKYNIRQLSFALNIIKELNLNRDLKDYKIKKIDVAGSSGISFYILVSLPLSGYHPPQPEGYIKGQAIIAAKEVEVKLDAGAVVRDNINILAGLFSQIRNEMGDINYIDLRFKEPVIKLNEARTYGTK